MQRSHAASQLALWIGRKGKGSATLRWSGKEITLFVSALQIVGAEGDDGDFLAASLGMTGGGEWFHQAQSAVDAGQVSHGEAVVAVKRAIAENLRSFFVDPLAEVTFDTALPPSPQGLTISYPHIVVEMVLAEGGDTVVPVLLPNPTWSLRRLADFAPRVGALGLPDEAIAVLAKINDVRTAQEIADPSPHGRDLALRLLAAVVGAGLVESTPRVPEVFMPHLEGIDRAAGRRRGRLLRIIAVIGAVIAVALALAYFQPWPRTPHAGSGGPWGIAVDAGCRSSELEALYRRQDQDRDNLRLAPFGQGDEQCSRLVWGHFPTKEAADQAMASLPDKVLRRGFAPYVVRAESKSP